MSFREFMRICNKDKIQWRKELGGKVNFLFLFIFLREYRIIVFFRLCAYFRSHWYFLLAYFVIRLLYRHITLSNGVDIPSHVEIGGGWVIHHCNGIVIHPAAKIGENFIIRSGCVIGCNNGSVPVIADNVTLGVHVTIIGDVNIASGCIIGAGAVITKSTEPNGVYAGVPAKIIKNRVSE